MKTAGEFRETVRVQMQLPEGYTRVFLERTAGVGLANGGATWDIPTSEIPSHLRAIGSRFVVIREQVLPQESDQPSNLREALKKVKIEEIDAERK